MMALVMRDRVRFLSIQEHSRAGDCLMTLLIVLWRWLNAAVLAAAVMNCVRVHELRIRDLKRHFDYRFKF